MFLYFLVIANTTTYIFVDLMQINFPKPISKDCTSLAEAFESDGNNTTFHVDGNNKPQYHHQPLMGNGAN